MTTIDCNDLPVDERRSLSLFTRLGAAFANWREQSRRRRALGNVLDLDAYMLRDIGLSADDLDRAARGKNRSIWLEPLSREPSATARDRYSP
ncbi:MAG TPA: hypothetical protein VGD86_10970 [Devosia sp.]